MKTHGISHRANAARIRSIDSKRSQINNTAQALLGKKSRMDSSAGVTQTFPGVTSRMGIVDQTNVALAFNSTNMGLPSNEQRVFYKTDGLSLRS
jgi:hypothetical protein